jgi:acetyl esterase/lipase
MSNQQKLFTGAMAVLVTLAGAGVLARQTSSQTAPATAPRAKPMDLETILLWPDGAPAALGSDDSDKPSVTVYLARQPNGTAIVVAPGGGYGNLAANHEGRQVANLLNAAGVTAFVLKYRLGPRYHHPVELGDAQRAIRLVRARAAEFGILGDRIGMLGFSAGGHLTATAGTRFDTGRADAPDPIDRVSSRPDFLVLAYPVISFDPAITHSGSVRNLLGDKPDPKLRSSPPIDR